MQTEQIFVIWSSIRIKSENRFKPPVAYNAIRSNADILMLIMFVVILVLWSPAIQLPPLCLLSCCCGIIVVIFFNGCPLCVLFSFCFVLF